MRNPISLFADVWLNVLLTAAATVAQAPPASPPADPAPALRQHMEQLSGATMALQDAIVARDRAAIDRQRLQLIEIAQRLPATLPEPTAPNAVAAVAAITAAATDLGHPIGDGADSDAHDLARLRRACTGCHVHHRDADPARGLFPNRDNLVTGTVRLLDRDGNVRPDASGVVVFLEGPGRPASPLPRPARISQRDRRFEPPVLVVTTGSTVAFPNDDVVFHNVFSLSRSNPFDLGTFGKGLSRERTLGTAGLVKVHCNIHPDMIAHVLVLDTALAAVTDRDGRWLLTDVPDGDYTLRVWQALADERRQPLVVRDGRRHELALEVRETKPRVQHHNKHGRTYPERY
jgi:hypothetical protein